MKTINLHDLKELALKHPEIKRLIAMKHAPVYLLQMELERYMLRLNSTCYNELKTLKI